LFVCTKTQFSSIVEDYAVASDSFFVTQRWLGGMLTNWNTIKSCIDNLNTFCDFYHLILLIFPKKNYFQI